MNRNHDATRNPRYTLAALPESRPKRARRRSGWGAWLAVAALALVLVAGAPGQAAGQATGLSASPNPSTNGSYTVSWTAKPGATSYQLFEGDTESYTGSSLSKAYSGKANGTYTYTLKYCIYAGFPVGTTICNIPSLYDALTVTVSDPPDPTGTISASPSPCSIPAGQRRCTTTVTWSTSNATKPCIFLSTRSKFACGASGTKDAPWVTSAGRTFLLKNGQTFSADTLASVTVSGTLLPPSAPTLSAPATDTDGAYRVSWSSPTGATRYQLQQQVGTGNWTASYTGTGSSKAFTGKGDGTYSYRAKACIGTAPCSGWSTTVSVRVLHTLGIPGAISAPTNDTDGTYTVRWGAASGSVATYELQERTGSNGSWATVQNTSARSKSVSKTADATYQYQVRACNALSCSGWTAAKSVRVLRTPGVPGAISGPATDTDGTYTVRWGAASGAVATYELQERTGSSGSWSTVQNTSARSKSISKTADATYQYQVRACNELSCSGWTAAKSVRVLRTPGVPGAISGPTNDTDGIYTVSWRAASGTVATYELQERTGSSGSWSTVQNTSARSKPVSKSADATYRYQVRACNELSCSDWTAAKSVQVLRTPGVPGAISGPANDADGSFTLSWRAASGTVATYELQERTGSGGSWATVQNTSARSKSVSKRANATYQYQVRACNRLSCGQFTSVKTVQVALSSPPVAIDDAATTTRNAAVTIDVLANDSASGGAALTVQSATDPRNGSVTVNGGATVTYTPDAGLVGSDTFDYTITDGTATASATVTVTVENRRPVAGADSASTTVNTAVTVDVLANDIDPDGDALSVSSATDPANGSVTVNADGTIAYTPDAAYAGTDSFTYTVSDGIDTATGKVMIAIGGYTVETPPAPYDAPTSLVTATEQSDIDRTGTMPGAFRVTESGAASYAIPIYAVPGTAGVTPELALTYNSQAGNGVAGLGWTIDGVSAIVRCRATRHQDAAAKPIQWNGQDKFCLDGQRLVLDSGTYGAPNATYRTEIDSYARIKALGGTAGHPDYFEVSAKDGSKRYYGNVPGGAHTDAKQRNGSSQTLKWALKRFEDNIGNPIWYLYDNDADGHRLTGVRYAYGAQRSIGDHHAWIEFVYEDREDDATGYVAGHAFASRKRLDKVRTHNHNGSALTVVRELRLAYADVSARLDKTSRLTSIKECAGSATTAPCLEPTTFAWQAGTAGFRPSYTEARLTPRADRGVLNYYPADVNGDGLIDLVWLEWDADSGGDTDHHLKYALSNGTNLVQASFDSGAASVELHDDLNTVQEVVVRTIDYNGDGRADAAVWRQRDPVWRVHLSTPQATGGWKLSATPVATTLVTKHADFSDLNGDGLLDAIYTRDKTIYARYLEKDTTQPLTSSRYYTFGAEAALYTRKPVGNVVIPGQSIDVEAANHDFNGDGRADLIATFRTSILGGSVGVTKRPFVIGADGTWTEYASFSDYDVHPVDLNRDGLTDLIREQRSATQGRTLQVAINTGSGFTSHALAATLNPRDNDILPPIDHNGDGHPDFVWHDRQARGIKAYFWNPSTNAFAIPTVPHTVRTTDGKKNRAHLFFDANGDGHTDYVHLTDLNDKGKLRTYLSNDTDRKPDRVTTIGNGLGAVTEIDYETLSTTDHYERLDVKRVVTPARFCLSFLGTSDCVPYGNPIDSDVETTDDMGRPLPDEEIASRVKAKLAERTAAFYKELNSGWNLPSGAQTLGKVGPVLEFTGPADVVTRVDSSAPKAGATPGAVIGGAKSAIEYFYADAKVQAMGRGLLGFGQLMTKDMQTAVETTTAYRHDFPFTGLPAKTTVRTAAERVLSELITTWKLTGHRSTWAATAQRSGTAALGALRPHASKTVEKTFDLTAGSNDDPALLTTVTTDSVYDANGNLTSSTVTTVGGGKTFATATANTYGPSDADRQTGRLTSTVVTHSRDTDGDGTPETATRRSDFSYYGQAACPVTSAAQAGLLCEEIVEPARPADKVVTTHYHDAFGNRKKSRVVAGSGTDGITRCDRVTTTYDSRGRFVEATADCLGRKTSEVTQRDAHGTPTSVRRYTSAGGADYVTETAATTSRGAVYFERSATGAHTLTTRKKGTHGQCPTGTAFHERVRPGGGGESVSCFDALAREIRAATAGFAAGSWIHVDTEYDSLGRIARVSEPHYGTETGCAAGGENATPKSRCWTEFDYDILGRVTQTTLPDGSVMSTAYAGLTTTRTNALNQRRTETVNALGETVGTSDHLGATIGFGHDAQGNLTSVVRTKASSDASAAPATVTTTMAYDLLGRRTGMTDPDKGAWSYRHNALGELVCQKSAAGHTTRMTYDGLGRLATRKDYRSDSARCDRAASGTLEANAAWTYDASPGGLGQLASMSDAISGYRKDLAYDRFGRLSTTETRPGTGNGSHFEKTTYDERGRVFQSFDATRASRDFTDHGVRHVYNGNGYLEKLQDAVGSAGAGGTFTPRAVYRTVTAMDARGNVTAETLGNGIKRNHAYDGRTGRVRTVRSGLGMAGNRQDLAYDWDLLGNLSQRERTRNGTTLTEEFCYDDLNRLERSRLTTEAGARAKDLCDSQLSQLTGVDTVTYDSYGNIRTKSGVGTYAYGAGGAGPHAVTSVTKAGHPNVTYAYDANGNNTSGDGRSIAHTAFDKPKSIDKGNHTTTFAYGPDRSRFKRVDTVTEGTGASRTERTTTTLYIGSVERITRPSGHVQIKRRIGGVAIETVGSADGGCGRSDATAIQYVLRDHLGSVDVLTDASGAIDRDMGFDAWGRRAAPSTGEPLADSAAKAFDNCDTTRGFTGHEMLDEVGIVHMNGRIYDPLIARFLQADPYVQFPNDLQSHNRYSYVLNNPMAHTDPSGHFVFTLSAMAFAAQQGLTFATVALIGAAGFADAMVQGAGFEQALQSGFLSGISAAAFAGIGNVVGTHFGGTFAAGLSEVGFGLKVALHGTVGGITSALGGGGFGHGFAAAGFTALGTSFNNSNYIGGKGFSPLRVAVGATIGGTASRISGGKFANGAITGAFSQALNQEQSEIDFKNRLVEAYDAAATAAAPVKERIKAAASASENGTVDLSQEELGVILLEQALAVQLEDPYGGLIGLQFDNAMRGADGWFFFEGRAGVSFNLLDADGAATGRTFYGSDINYTHLGFAAASTGRSLNKVTGLIQVWNLRQILFLEGSPSHNWRQITVGDQWMREGYRFYNENKVR